MCVCVVPAGISPFLPGLLVEPVWPHWRPRVRSLPIIAGPRCRPRVRPCIAPRPVRYALGPEPGSLPQDHPGSGVVAPWLPPGQLHGISSASPSSPCCPVLCVYWGFSQLVGLAAARRPPRPTQFGDFPRKDALDARLPPPAYRQARSGDRSHDLSVARPTLSPVELAGDVCCSRGLFWGVMKHWILKLTFTPGTQAYNHCSSVQY